MMFLFKLAVFEAWVLGVFAASWRTERALAFALDSRELLLLGFAVIFALHTGALGLFRIENRRQRELNGISLAIFAAVGLWVYFTGPELEDQATLFWALGPMALALVFARAAHFFRVDPTEERD